MVNFFDPGHAQLMKEWFAVSSTSNLKWLSLAVESLEFMRAKTGLRTLGAGTPHVLVRDENFILPGALGTSNHKEDTVKKNVLLSLVAGLVLFVWGFISWVVLP